MLAIIGGTGLYQLEALERLESVKLTTPFGLPSAPVVKARYKDMPCLFLPRHGTSHQFLPHEINYRANIFALKALGARQIISISAVGSLRETIKPGQFAIASQYFDWVKGHRISTFFGKGLSAHISTAEPTCQILNAWIANMADSMALSCHTNKTYACVNGPRLSTQAESRFLQGMGCDLVGMTHVPEVFLAREAQLCYASINIVTDYDSCFSSTKRLPTVADILANYKKNIGDIQKMLLKLIASARPVLNGDHPCRQSLKEAVLTPDSDLSADQRALLSVLRQ